MYFDLHAQETEIVLPVAHSANSAPRHSSLATSKPAAKMNAVSRTFDERVAFFQGVGLSGLHKRVFLSSG